MYIHTYKYICVYNRAHPVGVVSIPRLRMEESHFKRHEVPFQGMVSIVIVKFFFNELMKFVFNEFTYITGTYKLVYPIKMVKWVEKSNLCSRRTQHVVCVNVFWNENIVWVCIYMFMQIRNTCALEGQNTLSSTHKKNTQNAFLCKAPQQEPHLARTWGSKKIEFILCRLQNTFCLYRTHFFAQIFNRRHGSREHRAQRRWNVFLAAYRTRSVYTGHISLRSSSTGAAAGASIGRRNGKKALLWRVACEVTH